MTVNADGPLPDQRSLRDRAREELITVNAARRDAGLPPLPDDLAREWKISWLASRVECPYPYVPLKIHAVTPELRITRMGRITWHAYVVTETMAGLPGAFAWTRKRAVAKALRDYDRWKARQDRHRETIPLDAAREERS